MTKQKRNNLIGTEEAAEILECTQQTVRNYARQNKIRHWKRGRNFLFEEADVVAYWEGDEI